MNKNLNNYDDEESNDFLKMFTKPKKIITRAVKQHEHYYPFHGYIESFEDYDDLVELLLTVPEGDTVRLYISSGGGRLDVADMIVSRICEAQQRGVHVVAELGQTVASAATFVALSCNELFPSPNCQWLLHPWSNSVGWGFAQNTFNASLFNKKQSDRFMRETYGGFLTEDELNSLIEFPRDLEFDAEEVMERWENLQKYREQEYLNMVEEIKAAQEEANKPTSKKKAPTKKTAK